MPAAHKSTTYKPLPVPNPFREGQDKAYADILKDKMDETRWWRGFVGIGVLVLFALSLVFFIIALSQQKTVPVLVNVMPNGEAQYLGEVRQQGTVQAPEAAIQYQVRLFITNLRSVSTDPQVLYNNIDTCYAMVTGSYEPVMTRFLRGASPFDLVGKARRTVEIESALRITANSYQIDWIESTIDSAASRTGKRMRALVTVRLLPVTDDTIRKNPLGIYIDNCEMTEL
jgi:type IV secretion system protein VirB5